MEKGLWRDPGRASRRERYELSKGGGSALTATQSSESESESLERKTDLKTSNENGKRNVNTTVETKKNVMPSETLGEEKISSELQNVNEITTSETPSGFENKSMPAKTAEIQRESSERFRENCRQVGLGSAMLLGKSANKLMALIEESVNESDLQQSQEGVKRVEMSRVSQVIDCANALAHLVQVQTNLMKVFK